MKDEKRKLAAVKQDGYAIKFIDSPSEAIQLAAVKQDGYALQFIDSPSEEVQLAAITDAGEAIKFIDSPSEEVQLINFTFLKDAISRDGDFIQIGHIKRTKEEWLSLEDYEIYNDLGARCAKIANLIRKYIKDV